MRLLKVNKTEKRKRKGRGETRPSFYWRLNSSHKERWPPFWQIDLRYERSGFNRATSSRAQLCLVHITEWSISTLPQLGEWLRKSLLRRLLVYNLQYSVWVFSFFFSPAHCSQLADSGCVFTQNTVKWRKVILVGILKRVPVSLGRGDRNVMTPCEWCQSALWWETDKEDLYFGPFKTSVRVLRGIVEHIVGKKNLHFNWSFQQPP